STRPEQRPTPTEVPANSSVHPIQLCAEDRTRPVVRHWWLLTPSIARAVCSTALFIVVSALGGMITYEPLRHLAGPTAHDLAAWWPTLVYGPWLAAVLSILRRRPNSRTKTAWIVLLCFSGHAVILCMTQAPQTLTGITAAALPPVAALTCIHLLVPHFGVGRKPRHADVVRGV
ncbi:hypothetical protein ABZT43_30775, partial [Streptomyces sp. NPDC005349]